VIRPFSCRLASSPARRSRSSPKSALPQSKRSGCECVAAGLQVPGTVARSPECRRSVPVPLESGGSGIAAGRSVGSPEHTSARSRPSTSNSPFRAWRADYWMRRATARFGSHRQSSAASVNGDATAGGFAADGFLHATNRHRHGSANTDLADLVVSLRPSQSL
jgi:hypothetical protein